MLKKTCSNCRFNFCNCEIKDNLCHKFNGCPICDHCNDKLNMWEREKE